jgi:ankyrin repeat protein
VKDKNGSTPLHRATWFNKEETAKLFLEKGAKVNARDNRGKTALHRACSDLNRVEVVDMLLENGADRNARDNLGIAARLIAKRRGNEGIARLLLNRK